MTSRTDTDIPGRYRSHAPRMLSTLVVTALLLAAGTADAALTTGTCLAQKQTAWGTLRKCQATERAKVLKGKTADLGKCQTKFQGTLAKISAKGAKATIACRYGDNGDGTVTDYDSGPAMGKEDRYPRWALSAQRALRERPVRLL